MGTFECFALVDLIEDERRRLTANCFITLIFGVFGVIILYFFNGRVINLLQIFVIILYLGGIGYATYSQLVREATILKKTVIHVAVSTDEIVVKTGSFKVLFLIDRPSSNRTFKLNEVRVSSTSYPLKQIYDLNGGVFVLSGQKKDFFIISDYFDEDLKRNLMEIYNR